MRFDFVPIYGAGEPLPWNQVARQMAEEAQLAEQAGFTAVWAGEHHFATPAKLLRSPYPRSVGRTP